MKTLDRRSLLIISKAYYEFTKNEINPSAYVQANMDSINELPTSCYYSYKYDNSAFSYNWRLVSSSYYLISESFSSTNMSLSLKGFSCPWEAGRLLDVISNMATLMGSDSGLLEEIFVRTLIQYHFFLKKTTGKIPCRFIIYIQNQNLYEIVPIPLVENPSIPNGKFFIQDPSVK